MTDGHAMVNCLLPLFIKQNSIGHRMLLNSVAYFRVMWAQKYILQHILTRLEIMIESLQYTGYKLFS